MYCQNIIFKKKYNHGCINKILSSKVITEYKDFFNCTCSLFFNDTHGARYTDTGYTFMIVGLCMSGWIPIKLHFRNPLFDGPLLLQNYPSLQLQFYQPKMFLRTFG